MSSVPSDLKYTRSHEWVRIEGDTATIGITDHAQEELGDVVYIELPTVGRMLATDDVLGTVESVKAVSEIYAPCAGEVIEVNEALVGSEATINETPYDAGWMVKLRLRDPKTGDLLLDAARYLEVIGES